MSDFLKRLMARSSGTEAVIRPRLASLFEPLPIGPAARFGTISEPFGEPPAAEEIEMGHNGERFVSSTPEASQASATRPTMEALPSVSRSMPVPGLPAEERQQAQSTSLVSPVASETSPSAGPVARVSAVEPLSMSRPPRVASSASFRFETISEALGGPSVAEGTAHGLDGERLMGAAAQVPVSAAVSRAAVTVQNSRRGGTSKKPAADSHAGQPRGKEPAQSQRPSLIPRPNPAGAILPPRTKVASEFSRLQMPVQSRKEREPTIQVTIGRIEVRATSTPAPVSGKERSTPRVMSLDEYLQRRTGRGGQ